MPARKGNGGHAHGLWPGIAGFLSPLGTVYYDMWDWFEGALAECLDEVPGVRIGLETKPYEPAPNNIYRNTADGLVMARDVEARLKNPVNRRLLAEGHCLVGFQPEIGHVMMGFEILPYSYMRITREARLQHVHVNSQPLGNYDQDLNVGVVNWQDTEALLYALKMVGYSGFFGIDINPERMPVMEAIKVNARALSGPQPGDPRADPGGELCAPEALKRVIFSAHFADRSSVGRRILYLEREPASPLPLFPLCPPPGRGEAGNPLEEFCLPWF
jgi:hypothetical protein